MDASGEQLRAKPSFDLLGRRRERLEIACQRLDQRLGRLPEGQHRGRQPVAVDTVLAKQLAQHRLLRRADLVPIENEPSGSATESFNRADTSLVGFLDALAAAIWANASRRAYANARDAGRAVGSAVIGRFSSKGARSSLQRAPSG